MKSSTPFYDSLLITIVSILCMSCEGLKFVTLYNKTGSEITVETRPELPVFGPITITDTMVIMRDRMTYRLAPDSSLKILGSFTLLLFNMKIKERNLYIDYLCIYTPTDTIMAGTKKEIIKLIKDPKTKYQRKLDKGYTYDNNKNFEAIIIRK